MLDDGGGVLRRGPVRACPSRGASDDDATLAAVAELARGACAPSKERLLETTAQGRAFLDATRAAWPCAALDRSPQSWDGALAYPVAVAVAAAGHGIPLEPALAAFLQALAANWISAGVRLMPLGQTDGQRVLAALEPVVAARPQRARLPATLDDIGQRRVSAPTLAVHAARNAIHRGCSAAMTESA